MARRSTAAVLSDDLDVGERVFCPPHGVAKVISIEDRSFGGPAQEFYVLELTRGGHLLVPTNNLGNSGMRPLVSANKAKQLLRKAKTKPRAKKKVLGWKERASLYNDGLRSGSSERYTEVLQELMYRAKADKLSTSEQTLLDRARSYFITEVGAVLDVAAERLEKDLATAVEKHFR